MGWLDDLMHTKVFNDKFKNGGPIFEDEVVSGGPPNRGRKMYGDSLFGYKKGGRIPKRFFGGLMDVITGTPAKPHTPEGPSKFSEFMNAPLDKGTFDLVKGLAESYTGKKINFKKGGVAKRAYGGLPESVLSNQRVLGGLPIGIYPNSGFGQYMNNLGDIGMGLKKGGHAKKFIK